MPDIVYILTHPAMDGLIKIGRTHDLTERMQNLYNSSVPAPFICHYAARVSDAKAVEDDLLALHRHSGFLQEVVIDIEEQDPQEDIEASNRSEEVMERQRNFDFGMVGIAEGSVLTFVRRDEITCCVVQLKPPRVRLEPDGEPLSISAAAKKVLGVQYGVNGTQYWMYQGETIWERRQRLG